MKEPNWKNLAMINDGVIVKKSDIPNSGLGLFANRFFKKNEWITIYDGESITRTQAKCKKNVSHIASRDGVIVDGLKLPLDGRGGGSFSNCSKTQSMSNAIITSYLGILLLKATKDIEVDSEILVYYGRRGFLLSISSEDGSPS